MGLVHSRIAAGLMGFTSSDASCLDSTSAVRRPCASPEPSAPARHVSTSPTRPACTSARASIASLPQELLLHVFSYLGPRDLCGPVPQVCKQWYALSLDPQLYTALRFTRGEGSTHAVVALLRRAPRLRELTVEDRQDVGPILEEVCNHNPHLRVLELKRAVGSHRISASTMKRLVRNCPALRALKLHGCYVRGNVFYRDLSAHLPHLRTLYLVHGRKLSPGAVMHLANNPLQLEELRVYNNYGRTSYGHVPDEEVVAVCERFHESLRSVKLDLGEWSPAAFSALRRCARLEELSLLEAHGMTGEGLLAVAAMPGLRSLEVTCCAVSEAVWLRVFAGPALSRLTSLVLCRCNTTDKVAVAISLHLKSLRLLGVSGRLATHPQAAQGVSAAGVASIVRGCYQLSALELLYMDPTVEDAVRLIPQYLPGLAKLRIFQTGRADWESVTQVEALMPDLMVEYFSH